MAHNSSGRPTATLIQDDGVIVDHLLYWVACQNVQEAHNLPAIINSEYPYEAVENLMPKGQFGARHLHKHLWKLPIREFNANNSLHVSISDAGRKAVEGTAGAAFVAAGVGRGAGGGGGGGEVAWVFCLNQDLQDFGMFRIRL